MSGSEIDLNQQKSLLSVELSNRDLIIEQLQAEKQALDDKYQHSCLQVIGAIVDWWVGLSMQYERDQYKI